MVDVDRFRKIKLKPGKDDNKRGNGLVVKSWMTK